MLGNFYIDPSTNKHQHPVTNYIKEVAKQ